MEENPYKAPEQVEARRERASPKPIMTIHGCALAIVTGLVVGFGLLYLIGLVRSLT